MVSETKEVSTKKSITTQHKYSNIRQDVHENMRQRDQVIPRKGTMLGACEAFEEVSLAGTGAGTIPGPRNGNGCRVAGKQHDLSSASSTLTGPEPDHYKIGDIHKTNIPHSSIIQR